jgi:hypothetical protein
VTSEATSWLVRLEIVRVASLLPRSTEKTELLIWSRIIFGESAMVDPTIHHSLLLCVLNCHRHVHAGADGEGYNSDLLVAMSLIESS